MSEDLSNVIGKFHRVHVDYPIGSLHPDMGFIFPVNYGFLHGTNTANGTRFNAYVLGVFDQKKFFMGECVAVISRSDNTLHAVVVPQGRIMSDEQIHALVEFQERFYSYDLHRG